MKIKILKSFPTTHYGYLQKDREIDVSEHFGEYCVKRLKAAVEVKNTRSKKDELSGTPMPKVKKPKK